MRICRPTNGQNDFFKIRMKNKLRIYVYFLIILDRIKSQNVEAWNAWKISLLGVWKVNNTLTYSVKEILLVNIADGGILYDILTVLLSGLFSFLLSTMRDGSESQSADSTESSWALSGTALIHNSFSLWVVVVVFLSEHL